MKDKNIVLITGANSGIGNALARKLISENYFVIATSRNGKIENLISENLFVIELDITNQNSINKLNEIIRRVLFLKCIPSHINANEQIPHKIGSAVLI